VRFAVISDIHGNLVALEAVLGELAGDSCDEIVCLGDVASRGPQPRECLQRVRELGCSVVMGNTDEWLMGPNPTWDVPDDNNPIMEIDLWCAAQLDGVDRAYIRSFPATVDRRTDSGNSICLFHGSPRSNTENIFSTTPEAELEAMISGCEATVLVGGHTHIQMLRRIDGFDSRYNAVAPWAEFAIIDCRHGRLGVDFRRAPIDLQALDRAALASGMPHAGWWFAHRDRSLAAGPSTE
jgi:predicted phosphodiesterase